jgi:antitoxin Phd
MTDNIWQLQDAKSKFSKLVDQTLNSGVQIVTRRGQKTVVMLSYEEYEKLTRREGRLSQFLLDSPLAGSNLPIERERGLPRNIEIEP